MNKNNKKPAKAPVVENAQAEETNIATIIGGNKAFLKDFEGMDANHVVDCLTGLKEMVHDDPHAAEKFNMSNEQVQYFNEITLCGFATMIAIEVKSGRSPFAMAMSQHQIEAFNAVSQYTGITIDTKALPAPSQEGVVEVPSTTVKVEKKVAEAVAEEIAEAKKEIELDPTKFENDDDLFAAIKHILSTEKNAFSKFERSVALYRAYRKIQAGDDAEKSKKIDNMSYSEILDEIFDNIDRVPILLNGFGKALYSKVSQFANPVVAFCMLRESSRNKTTGIPAVDDSTIADIVKVLVKYCANQYIAENEAKIEATKADIEVLSKDKKKNAEGIKNLEARIETLQKNDQHYKDVIEFVQKPDSAFADSFLDDIEDKNSENYRAAREAFGFVTRAYYGADVAKNLNQAALKKNVQQYIGIITNLFLSPTQQIMSYKEAYVVELTENGGSEKN